MRTQIKRRMLALWLSVCMILTMMPSMAMPTFAAPPSDFTVQIDPDGKITISGGNATQYNYTVLSEETNAADTVKSWTDDDTAYTAAQDAIKALEETTWNECSSGDTKLNYDDNGKKLLVVGVTSEKVHGAAIKDITGIENPVPSLASITIKGQTVKPVAGNAIPGADASQINLSPESGKVIEMNMDYEAATGDANKFEKELSTDSQSAEVKAYLIENGVSESPSGRNNLANLVTSNQDEGELTGSASLTTEKTGDTKWIIVEVTSKNGGGKVYYVVKVNIAAADTGAKLESAAIKGVDVNLPAAIDGESADKVDLETTSENYAKVTIPYEDASKIDVDQFTSKVANEEKAKVTARKVTLNPSKEMDIATAFTDATDSADLKGQAALQDAKPEGSDPFWVVIEVKSEDGNTTNYYVLEVTISPAVGDALLTSATVKGVKVTLGRAITEEEDYTVNLSERRPARGEVSLTYTEASEDKEKAKFDGKYSKGATIEAVKVANIASLANVNVADQFGLGESITISEKGALKTGTVEETFWIIVKVTAANKTDINYYAIHVVLNAASDKAELTNPSIKGDEVNVPKAIAAGDAGSVDLSKAENYTPVPLTYEQAISTDLVTFAGDISEGAHKTVTLFKNDASGLEGKESQNLIKSGTTVGDGSVIDLTETFDDITEEAGGTCWLVVKVEPESKEADKNQYYVFKLEVQKEYIIVEKVVDETPEYGDYEDYKETDFKDIITEDNLKVDGAEFTKITDSLELDLSKEYDQDTLKDVSSVPGSELFLHVETFLDIVIENYDGTAGKETVTYEVKPMYNLVVSDNKVLSASGSSEVIVSNHLLDIPAGTVVTVNLPLPTTMKALTHYYIIHDDKYIYSGAGKPGASNNTNVEFTNPHGFSEFTITSEDPAVAKIGNVGYLTLKDAVADAQNDDVIELQKAPDETIPVVVDEGITLSVKGWTDAKQSDVEGLLTNGGSVTLEKDASKFSDEKTIKFTFTKKEAKPKPGDPFGPEDPDDSTTGELAVSKTVITDDKADKNKEFTFTVTVTADPAVNGSYGEMTFTNGVATITLKDGQSKTAIGLPAGAAYKVEETAAEGFTSSAIGATGTIGSIASTAAFTNTKEGVTPPTPTPTVEPSENGKLVFTDDRQPKALLDRNTTDKDCTLKLAADDGDELTSIDVKSSDNKVVKVVDGKLRYMDLGTAEITVTATGKSGKTYTTTFTVKVTKIGRPTLTVSHVSSKASKTFTVTTSTVRGADGFIVKYSLKKNMSNSGKKKFACGKKLKRQTITVKKAKTTYYVKVRAYKKVDGKIVKYAWSKETEKIKSK